MDIKYVQCIQTLLQCGVKTGRLHPNRCMIKVVLLWCLGGVDFRGRFQFGLFVNIKLITFLVRLTIITPSQPHYRSAGIQFTPARSYVTEETEKRVHVLFYLIMFRPVSLFRAQNVSQKSKSTCPAYHGYGKNKKNAHYRLQNFHLSCSKHTCQCDTMGGILLLIKH